MGLKEGSVILANLRCGCQEVRITLLHGQQRIKCRECGQSTVVKITINEDDEVGSMKVEWA